jgi:hypothetical protein
MAKNMFTQEGLMTTGLVNENQAAYFHCSDVLGDTPMENYTAYYTRLIKY